MTFEKILHEIISGLINTWNQNDMDSFSDYLTESVKVSSEHVKKVYPENLDDSIIGKNVVIDYWSKLTQILPIKYEGYDLVKIGSQAEVICHMSNSPKKSRLRFELDEYGKIKELHVEDFTPSKAPHEKLL